MSTVQCKHSEAHWNLCTYPECDCRRAEQPKPEEGDIFCAVCNQPIKTVDMLAGHKGGDAICKRCFYKPEQGERYVLHELDHPSGEGKCYEIHDEDPEEGCGRIEYSTDYPDAAARALLFLNNTPAPNAEFAALLNEQVEMIDGLLKSLPGILSDSYLRKISAMKKKIIAALQSPQGVLIDDAWIEEHAFDAYEVHTDSEGKITSGKCIGSCVSEFDLRQALSTLGEKGDG